MSIYSNGHQPRHIDIMVFCLVLGEIPAIKSLFVVDITKNISTVSHLQSTIKKLKKPDLDNFAFNKLILWKVNIPVDNEEKLKILDNTSRKIDIKQDLEGVELLPSDEIPIDFREQQPPSKKIIHIIVQALATGKRKLEGADEKSKGQESKKMKLVATANKIMEGIMKLSDTCEVYSDPKNFLTLPFPFPGSDKPVDRFAINVDGFFTFMGRTEFNNVLSEIMTFRLGTGYREMFIYGTVGYGKSHILTAIACFLLRSRRRVVYLPDCRKLIVGGMDYIKSALFLTYVDDDTKTAQIDACESFDQIIKFCEELGETLYFIVDQMNALDYYDGTGADSERKRQVKEDIDRLCLNHYYIKSSSANNHTVLHFMQKQTSEKKIALYGGFDVDEIKEWWKKHNSILPTMNEMQKNQVEDTTGNIPLFLNILLESSHKNFEEALGYLNDQLTLKIKDPMTNFSKNIKEGRQEFHVKLMSSFLTKIYPPSGFGVDDFDHRFFYIKNGLCYYVCGMARDCMADYFYEKKRMEIFTDIKWISCIKEFKNNPPVKRFITENACIASIFKNGIMVNHINFKPNDMEFFCDEKEIKFSSNEGKCILYLPRCWNQEAIDGLLISKTNNKLYVAPIQITFDISSHSDSEDIFFSSIWPNLKSNLSVFENRLEIIFIWITSESDTDVKVNVKYRTTQNNTFEINLNYTQVVMGFGNVNRDINQYLS
ncbi:hypothetical protein Glove_85g77 [Diversispora epigaea]|uniref:Crinkler effector protein N-terminal domain-containing protein n=1 Tax=Diversispora epigaea TaxID=1348612 RepID=A0A397JFW4_9GLOM|nr:hypothetical protein Glove_85g77 [Diversispora epigaea]